MPDEGDNYIDELVDWFGELNEQLPGALQFVNEFLFGRVPEASVGRIYNLADAWGDTARRFSTFADDISGAADPILEAWGGDDSAIKFQQNWQEYVTSLNDIAEGIGGVEEMVSGFGLEVETEKLMVGMALLFLAITIVIVLATLVVSIGTSAGALPVAWGAAKTAIQAAFDKLIQAILRQGVRKTVALALKKLLHKLLIQIPRRVITNAAPRRIIANALARDAARAAMRQGGRDIERALAKRAAERIALKAAQRGTTEAAQKLGRMEMRNVARGLERDLARQMGERLLQEGSRLAGKKALETAGGRAVTRAVSDKALEKMLDKQLERSLGREIAKRLGAGALGGAKFMGGQNLAVQLIELAEGHRPGFDLMEFGTATGSGALMGALTHGNSYFGRIASGATAGAASAAASDGVQALHNLATGQHSDINWGKDIMHGAGSGALYMGIDVRHSLGGGVRPNLAFNKSIDAFHSTFTEVRAGTAPLSAAHVYAGFATGLSHVETGALDHGTSGPAVTEIGRPGGEPTALTDGGGPRDGSTATTDTRPPVTAPLDTGVRAGSAPVTTRDGGSGGPPRTDVPARDTGQTGTRANSGGSDRPASTQTKSGDNGGGGPHVAVPDGHPVDVRTGHQAEVMTDPHTGVSTGGQERTQTVAHTTETSTGAGPRVTDPAGGGPHEFRTADGNTRAAETSVTDSPNRAETNRTETSRAETSRAETGRSETEPRRDGTNRREHDRDVLTNAGHEESSRPAARDAEPAAAADERGVAPGGHEPGRAAEHGEQERRTTGRHEGDGRGEPPPDRPQAERGHEGRHRAEVTRDAAEIAAAAEAGRAAAEANHPASGAHDAHRTAGEQTGRHEDGRPGTGRTGEEPPAAHEGQDGAEPHEHPLSTGAKEGEPPTERSIEQGTVRMEDHPRYQEALRFLEEHGVTLKETDGDPFVWVRHILDRAGNVLRVEIELNARPGMRFLDLEHEMDHVRQVTSSERFPDGALPQEQKLLRDNGTLGSPKLRGPSLKLHQRDAMEYHVRLTEYIRLHERGVDPAVLREHAEGVDIHSRQYNQQAHKYRDLRPWVDQHFSDIHELRNRVAELRAGEPPRGPGSERPPTSRPGDDGRFAKADPTRPRLDETGATNPPDAGRAEPVRPTFRPVAETDVGPEPVSRPAEVAAEMRERIGDLVIPESEPLPEPPAGHPLDEPYAARWDPGSKVMVLHYPEYTVATTHQTNLELPPGRPVVALPRMEPDAAGVLRPEHPATVALPQHLPEDPALRGPAVHQQLSDAWRTLYHGMRDAGAAGHPGVEEPPGRTRPGPARGHDAAPAALDEPPVPPNTRGSDSHAAPPHEPFEPHDPAAPHDPAGPHEPPAARMPEPAGPLVVHPHPDVPTVTPERIRIPEPVLSPAVHPHEITPDLVRQALASPHTDPRIQQFLREHLTTVDAEGRVVPKPAHEIEATLAHLRDTAADAVAHPEHAGPLGAVPHATVEQTAAGAERPGQEPQRPAVGQVRALAFDGGAGGTRHIDFLTRLAGGMGGLGDSVAMHMPDTPPAEVGPGVHVVGAEPLPGVTGRLSPLLRPERLPGDVDILIGYGETAGVADVRLDAYPDAKVVQILDRVPTDPNHLDLLVKADLVVAIGSDAAVAIRRAFEGLTVDRVPPVHEVPPAFEARPQPPAPEGRSPRLVVVGEDRAAALKAARVVAELRSRGVHDVELTVAVTPDRAHSVEMLQLELSAVAGRSVEVRILEGPDALPAMIQDAHLVLAPSHGPILPELHVRAAEHGVALLADRQSPVGRMLEGVAGGHESVLSERGVAAWADRVEHALGDLGGERARAADLRDGLAQRYAPAESAAALHRALGSLGEHVTRVDEATFRRNLDIPAAVRRLAADLPPVEAGRTRVMTVTTEWVSNKGGVPTANRDLSHSIANDGHEVYSRVSTIDEARPGELATTSEKVHVLGVDDVWGVTDHKGEPDRRAFSMLLKNLPPEVDVVVGHSRFGGGAGQWLVEHVYPGAKYVHVLHTSPELLDALRGSPAEGRAHAETERAFMARSDMVAGVGPLLGREAARLSAETGLARPPRAHEIISDMPAKGSGPPPRPADRVGVELSMQGRANDRVIKGIDFAADVVKALHDAGVDARLTVRGFRGSTPEHTAAEMAEFARVLSDRAGVVVEVKPFTTDGRELTQDLYNADLMVMPSVHEGFGLVASEAAQHGVVVLVGEGTGAGLFFNDARYVPSDIGPHFVVSDRATVERLNEALAGATSPAEAKAIVERISDGRVSSWVERIQDTLTHLDERRADALRLRQHLNDAFPEGASGRRFMDAVLDRPGARYVGHEPPAAGEGRSTAHGAVEPAGRAPAPQRAALAGETRPAVPHHEPVVESAEARPATPAEGNEHRPAPPAGHGEHRPAPPAESSAHRPADPAADRPLGERPRDGVLHRLADRLDRLFGLTTGPDRVQAEHQAYLDRVNAHREALRQAIDGRSDVQQARTAVERADAVRQHAEREINRYDQAAETARTEARRHRDAAADLRARADRPVPGDPHPDQLRRDARSLDREAADHDTAAQQAEAAKQRAQQDLNAVRARMGALDATVRDTMARALHEEQQLWRAANGGSLAEHPPVGDAHAGPRVSRLTGTDAPPTAAGSRLYDRPFGMQRPLAEHQAQLERALRTLTGGFQRAADPAGGWLRLLNGFGLADVARRLNCLDCVASLYDTFVHGRPTVAAPRTFDAYNDARSDASLRGEHGGPGRLEDLTGARFQSLLGDAQGRPAHQGEPHARAAFDALRRQLEAGGHGSFAAIVTGERGGNAHAWAALNHKGVVHFVDPQMDRVVRVETHNGQTRYVDAYTNRPVEHPVHDPAHIVRMDALVVDGQTKPMPFADRPAGAWSDRPLTPEYLAHQPADVRAAQDVRLLAGESEAARTAATDTAQRAEAARQLADRLAADGPGHRATAQAARAAAAEHTARRDAAWAQADQHAAEAARHEASARYHEEWAQQSGLADRGRIETEAHTNRTAAEALRRQEQTLRAEAHQHDAGRRQEEANAAQAESRAARAESGRQQAEHDAQRLRQEAEFHTRRADALESRYASTADGAAAEHGRQADRYQAEAEHHQQAADRRNPHDPRRAQDEYWARHYRQLADAARHAGHEYGTASAFETSARTHEQHARQYEGTAAAHTSRAETLERTAAGHENAHRGELDTAGRYEARAEQYQRAAEHARASEDPALRHNADAYQHQADADRRAAAQHRAQAGQHAQSRDAAVTHAAGERAAARHALSAAGGERQAARTDRAGLYLHQRQADAWHAGLDRSRGEAPAGRSGPRVPFDPEALRPQLRATYESLTDAAARAEVARLFSGHGNQDHLAKALDGMQAKAGSRPLDEILAERHADFLAKEALRNTPPPPDVIRAINAELGRESSVRTQIDDFARNRPDVAGVDRWHAKLRDELAALRSRLGGGPATRLEHIDSHARNIRAIEAEVVRAAKLPGVVEVGREFRDVYDGTEPLSTEIDVIYEGGRAWADVKDVHRFSDHENSSDFKEHVRQVTQQLRVSVLADGVRVGEDPPRVERHYTRGVDPEVARRLEAITVVDPRTGNVHRVTVIGERIPWWERDGAGHTTQRPPEPGPESASAGPPGHSPPPPGGSHQPPTGGPSPAPHGVSPEVRARRVDDALQRLHDIALPREIGHLVRSIERLDEGLVEVTPYRGKPFEVRFEAGAVERGDVHIGRSEHGVRTVTVSTEHTDGHVHAGIDAAVARAVGHLGGEATAAHRSVWTKVRGALSRHDVLSEDIAVRGKRLSAGDLARVGEFQELSRVREVTTGPRRIALVDRQLHDFIDRNGLRQGHPGAQSRFEHIKDLLPSPARDMLAQYRAGADPLRVDAEHHLRGLGEIISPVRLGGERFEGVHWVRPEGWEARGRQGFTVEVVVGRNASGEMVETYGARVTERHVIISIDRAAYDAATPPVRSAKIEEAVQAQIDAYAKRPTVQAAWHVRAGRNVERLVVSGGTAAALDAASGAYDGIARRLVADAAAGAAADGGYARRARIAEGDAKHERDLTRAMRVDADTPRKLLDHLNRTRSTFDTLGRHLGDGQRAVSRHQDESIPSTDSGGDRLEHKVVTAAERALPDLQKVDGVKDVSTARRAADPDRSNFDKVIKVEVDGHGKAWVKVEVGATENRDAIRVDPTGPDRYTFTVPHDLVEPGRADALHKALETAVGKVVDGQRAADVGAPTRGWSHVKVWTTEAGQQLAGALGTALVHAITGNGHWTKPELLANSAPKLGEALHAHRDAHDEAARAKVAAALADSQYHKPMSTAEASNAADKLRVRYTDLLRTQRAAAAHDLGIDVAPPRREPIEAAMSGGERPWATPVQGPGGAGGPHLRYDIDIRYGRSAHLEVHLLDADPGGEPWRIRLADDRTFRVELGPSASAERAAVQIGRVADTIREHYVDRMTPIEEAMKINAAGGVPGVVTGMAMGLATHGPAGVIPAAAGSAVSAGGRMLKAPIDFASQQRLAAGKLEAEFAKWKFDNVTTGDLRDLAGDVRRELGRYDADVRRALGDRIDALTDARDRLAPDDPAHAAHDAKLRAAQHALDGLGTPHADLVRAVTDHLADPATDLPFHGEIRVVDADRGVYQATFERTGAHGPAGNLQPKIRVSFDVMVEKGQAGIRAEWTHADTDATLVIGHRTTPSQIHEGLTTAMRDMAEIAAKDRPGVVGMRQSLGAAGGKAMIAGAANVAVAVAAHQFQVHHSVDLVPYIHVPADGISPETVGIGAGGSMTGALTDVPISRVAANLKAERDFSADLAQRMRSGTPTPGQMLLFSRQAEVLTLWFKQLNALAHDVARPDWPA